MSLLDALSPTISRLSLRYAQGPLPAFFAWWGGQLRSLLPQRWQQALEVRDAELWLQIEGDDLHVSHGSAEGERELARVPLAPADALPEALDGALEESLRDRRRVLLLPPDQVLRRRLQLPLAARDNLRAVLGFELDRQTPFRAEQVYFDSRVLGRDDAARTLPVELALVAREPVQAALARLGPLAAGLDAIDAGSPGGRLGYNFLPPEQRRRRVHRMLWINLALAMASLAFLVIAMGQLVDNRIAAVAALQADADSQRDAARAVSTLRASLEDAVAGANFLAVRKASQPSVVELLHSLTRTLPDDTFIERLNLSGTTLSLTGQSSQAAQLIERLRQAPGVRDAALSGAIQPDARSGKDRFNISAQVEARRQEAGDAPAPGR